MVVLDGFRMAINSDTNLDIKKSITVPVESMKLCAETLKGEITINTNNKYIEAKDENTTIVSRLLDGVYFDYKKFIPNNTNIVKIDVESFMNGVKYLKSFIGNKRLPMAWKENKICCFTDDGRFESDFNMSGHFNYYIGFNVDYLLDAIQQFKEKTLDFYMPERNINPLIIKHENSLALLMPVKIRENPFEETGEVA
jgi:DNA polymerase III sliding clamp (beta) subunit (PCNA family)